MAAVTATIAAVGVGIAAYGAYQQYQGSQASSEAQQQQINAEQAAEAQRMKAMELNARRESLERIRQGQRARHLGLVNATNQGAGLGSGVQGGFAQTFGQTATNLLGVTQNLEIGRNLFGISGDQSRAKIAQAQAGAQISTGQGLTSLGGSLVSNAGTIGNLSAGFGSGLGSAAFGIGSGGSNFLSPGSGSFGTGGPLSRTYTGRI